MIKYIIAVILATLAYSSSALPQAGSSISDRQMTINICRNLLKEAVADIDSGKYDEALTRLDSVFHCDQANPDAFYYKALILGWRADTVGVMKLLESGVEKAPLSSRLKVLLARYLIARGSHDKAWDHVESVLAIKPRECEALYLKGMILEERKDTAAAVETYRKALDISLSGIK